MGNKKSNKRRALLCGFGDPGHTFPLIALGCALQKRGYEATIQTWSRWRNDIEAEGLSFTPAPEYRVFPTRLEPLKPYQAAVKAARTTAALIKEIEPDVVVCDVITAAPVLASELEGVPWVTLVPHLYPINAPNLPPYGIGCMPPATAAGKKIWQRLGKLSNRGVELGRQQLNGARSRLGLPPLAFTHGTISRRLCLVGTYPQLEYPRNWPPYVEITGPLAWERSDGDFAEPPGDGPLVVVAPSTSKDPKHRLLRSTLKGLEGMQVRVIGTTNGLDTDVPLPKTGNSVVVDWLAYGKAMSRADLVICHGGHGTMARALELGVPVLAAPVEGDMAENAARAAWTGVGRSIPWRLVSATSILWTVRSILADSSYKERALELKRWSLENNGAENAAEAVTRLISDKAASTRAKPA